MSCCVGILKRAVLIATIKAKTPKIIFIVFAGSIDVTWVPIIAPVEMPSIKIIHKFLFILFPIFFNAKVLRIELMVMMHKDEPIITSGGISGNNE